MGFCQICGLYVRKHYRGILPFAKHLAIHDSKNNCKAGQMYNKYYKDIVNPLSKVKFQNICMFVDDCLTNNLLYRHLRQKIEEKKRKRERERERESVCVCVCVHACVYKGTCLIFTWCLNS